MPTPESKGVLYRYKDPGQGWVYTNDPSSVPEALADSVEVFEAKAPAAVVPAANPALELEAEATQALEALPKKAKALGQRSKAKAQKVQREVGDVVPFVKDLDLPSVAVGFALALGLWVLSALLRRTGRILFKLGGIAVVVALVAGAYFGWLRRSAGLSGDALSSPQTIVKDAQKAATQMQQRLQKNEQLLKKLEESPR